MTSIAQRFKFRKARVRVKVSGTADRPRLSVYRSLNYLYAQLIDDSQGKTLAFASSREKGVKGKSKSGGSVQAAVLVGKLIAEKAQGAKIKKVVFDRGGRIYHGSVKALAEAAREGGLEF